MTVAVACNLSDGVVLGVDSAVSLSGPGGVVKVYENAEKLLQKQDKPIGVAVYGLANLRERSIGSYLRQFEAEHRNGVLRSATTMAEIVEAFRGFFWNVYKTVIVPDLEGQTGKKFSEIPPDQKPVIGFVIGGFLQGDYLAELWNIVIPEMNAPKSAKQLRKQGDFGANWFAVFEPIRRYHKGYDQALLDELTAYLVGLRGKPLEPGEQEAVNKIVAKHEYRIPFGAMPFDEGVSYVRFLVELVINHHRYALGAPVVGGDAKIGVVTYKEEKFTILR